MEITWLGHASFLITSCNGTKILTDPYDNSIGYKTFKDSANIVSISHKHFDHSYIKEIKGDVKIIDTLGTFNLCDISIHGIPSYHDNLNGVKRGSNIIFVFTIDGFNICHLGDLGHKLSKETLKQIGNIDILLIPVGGHYTIDGKEASFVAKSIGSSIIIPMHFKTPSLSFPLNGVEDFITNMKNGEKIHSHTLTIDKKIQGKNIVKILDPKNTKE